ncbi:MAG: nuclear transport factor 2 family protein [Treponema sp.]|jgi:hypothetical protein|nr:nuclear transport factor 2 family protein [Treponema sp.]
MEISEKDYRELLNRLEKTERENAKNTARNEVMNLTMKYFHYHQCFRDDLVVEECLAKKSPGIHSEHGASGVYEGYEHVAQWWKKRPNPPGKILLHSITTPIIEVAGDCKTAKGVFILLGVECCLTEKGITPKVYLQDQPSEDGRDIFEQWGIAKYGIDYIVEDGEWRIWHFHAYDFARAKFNKGWITYAQEMAKFQKETQNSGEKPFNMVQYATDKEIFYCPPADRPSTFNFTYDGMTSRLELFPPIPKPYDTFKDTFEY